VSDHKWPPKEEWIVVTHRDAKDGNEHIIRQCLACDLVKETIITPVKTRAWHEWITASGEPWVGEATPPPCIATGLVEVTP
jgi:hypothetical protein